MGRGHLGRSAGSYSKMPKSLIDGKVEPGEAGEIDPSTAPQAAAEQPLSPDEPVNQIKAALDDQPGDAPDKTP